MREKFLYIERKLVVFEEYAATILITATIFISIYSILMRWFNKSTGDWVLEFPINLLAWGTFIGAGAAIHYHKHVQAEIFVDRLPPSVRKVIFIFDYILLLILSAFLVYYGTKNVIFYIHSGERLYLMFNTPTFIVRTIIPISAVLWIFHFIMRLVEVEKEIK